MAWGPWLPAVVVFLSGLVRLRRVAWQRQYTLIAIVSVPCIAILGSGSILQMVFQQTVLPGGKPGSIITGLEFSTWSYVWLLLKEIIIEGSQVGPIVAFLLLTYLLIPA